MIRAIVELDLHAVDGIPGDEASREAVFDACLNRFDELGRNGVAGDPVQKDVVLATRRATQAKLHVRVLASTTDVQEVLHLALGRPGQRLPIGNLGAAHARLDVELTLQAVDDDFEMQLSRAPKDNLAGLPIDLDADSRILGGQLLERANEPLLVVRRLRRDLNCKESCVVACTHLNPVGLVRARSRRGASVRFVR